MTTMASQITSLTVVYSIVYSGADQRKHQSSASLAFVREIIGTGEFSAQRASNAANVSIWWRLHGNGHLVTIKNNIDRYIPFTVGHANMRIAIYVPIATFVQTWFWITHFWHYDSDKIYSLLFHIKHHNNWCVVTRVSRGFATISRVNLDQQRSFKQHDVITTICLGNVWVMDLVKRTSSMAQPNR